MNVSLPLINKSVLIAEDNEDIVALIEHYIKSAGAITQHTFNGKDATELARKQKYDAILLDINMPMLNGAAAAQKIRQDGYTGPIIALTAHNLTDNFLQKENSAFDLFLQKPFSKNNLVECINSSIMKKQVH